jgi:hypothetical protein
MHIIEAQGETYENLTSLSPVDLGICGLLLQACLEVYTIGVVRVPFDSP